VTAAAATTPAATPTRLAVAPTPAPTAKPIVREVQAYDVGFLDGCSPAELTLADASIRGAIRRGIPLFNKGDTAGCFEVYRDTALSVRGALPETCAGPRAALQLGLERAGRLATPAEKAYAVRDAFDGLLAVMTKSRAENAPE
jgi:serine protease Do